MAIAREVAAVTRLGIEVKFLNKSNISFLKILILLLYEVGASSEMFEFVLFTCPILSIPISEGSLDYCFIIVFSIIHGFPGASTLGFVSQSFVHFSILVLSEVNIYPNFLLASAQDRFEEIELKGLLLFH